MARELSKQTDVISASVCENRIIPAFIFSKVNDKNTVLFTKEGFIFYSTQSESILIVHCCSLEWS